MIISQPLRDSEPSLGTRIDARTRPDFEVDPRRSASLFIRLLVQYVPRTQPRSQGL